MEVCDFDVGKVFIAALVGTYKGSPSGRQLFDLRLFYVMRKGVEGNCFSRGGGLVAEILMVCPFCIWAYFPLPYSENMTGRVVLAFSKRTQRYCECSSAKQFHQRSDYIQRVHFLP